MEKAEFQEECARLLADRSHGASTLARQALEVLQRSAAELDGVGVQEFCTTMEERCTALAKVRPSMAVVSTQVERWREGFTVYIKQTRYRGWFTIREYIKQR